jgi:hypothetical protein
MSKLRIKKQEEPNDVFLQLPLVRNMFKDHPDPACCHLHHVPLLRLLAMEIELFLLFILNIMIH